MRVNVCVCEGRYGGGDDDDSRFRTLHSRSNGGRFVSSCKRRADREEVMAHISDISTTMNRELLISTLNGEAVADGVSAPGNKKAHDDDDTHTLLMAYVSPGPGQLFSLSSSAVQRITIIHTYTSMYPEKVCGQNARDCAPRDACRVDTAHVPCADL